MGPKVMRGLVNFITDVKQCNSKELEEARVNKEIGKIGNKLSKPQTLNGYERKKCVWKLVYCYLLGYNINFGQIEAVNLVSSTKYSEKSAGYVACSVLLSNNADILGLLVNLIQSDIRSSCESIASLGLNFLANVATDQIIEMTLRDIQFLCDPVSRTSLYIKKKAYLVLLAYARKRPDLIQPEQWIRPFTQGLQSYCEAGCLISLVSLLFGLIELQGCASDDISKASTELLLKINAGDVPSYGMHSGIAAPWLQVKLFAVLKRLPPPTKYPDLMEGLSALLTRIVGHLSTLKDCGTNSKRLAFSSTKKKYKELQSELSRFHSEHAIFFEAVDLILAYGNHLDSSIQKTAARTLISINDSNDTDVRYLRLERLARLAVNLDVATSLSHNLNSVIRQLYEPDESLRHQALNLLFSVCSQKNWQLIVNEFLELLKNSTTEPILQEDLIIKTAILVETHAPDFTWYIDTVFTMMEYAPEAIIDDVWHRVIQILSGEGEDNEQYQIYAARRTFDSLADLYAHEVLVKMGAYILGEFGYLIQKEAPGKSQFNVLHKHFGRVSSCTKSILLLSFAKLANTHPKILDQVMAVFQNCSDVVDLELQQRALELAQLCQLNENVLDVVLSCMPAYPEAILNTSFLIRRLKNQKIQRQNRSSVNSGISSNKQAFNLPLLVREHSAEADEKETSDEDREERNSTSSQNNENSSEKTSDSNETPETLSSSDSSSKASNKNSLKTSNKKHTSKNEQLILSLQSVLPLEESVIHDRLALWKRVSLLLNGALLVTPELRIDVQQQILHDKCRLLVYVTNCSATAQIQLQSVKIEPSPNIKVDVHLNPHMNVPLPPKTQVKQAIELTFLTPFMNPPQYVVQVLSLDTNQCLTFSSALPILITSFISPFLLTGSKLKKNWKEMSETVTGVDKTFLVGPVHESLTRFTSLDVKNVLVAYLEEGFHLKSQLIDSSICGSGVLNTGSSAVQGSNSLLCLVKIDLDSSKSNIKLAVRSTSLIVAQYVLHALSLYFLRFEQPKHDIVSWTQQTPLSCQLGIEASSPVVPAFPTM